MSKLQRALGIATLALACGGAAQADPVFAPGGSSIFFNNNENLYRSTTVCTPATCLASTTGDPTGYQRINPTVAGNIQAGDIFIGIIDVQNIRSSVSGTNTYDSAAGDRFTGYFAQQVTAVTFPDTFNPVPDATTAHITLGATTDPFGILAAGEMFRLYAETPSFSSGGSASDVTGNIALATAGTLWAGLGLGTPPDGYAYTHTDITTAVTSSNTEAFFALNVLNKYNVGAGGYNAGTLALINDFNESEIGGYPGQGAGQLLCSPAQIADPTISCTELVGTSEIESNTEFGTTSPWMYASNDPFRLFQVVPEPGTLALVGLALAVLGLRSRRVF